MSRMVITLGGDVHIDQQKLVAAARQVLTDQRAVSLMDVTGHEMVVQAEQGQVFLESPSKGKRYQLDELMILSPHQEERTRALQTLVDLLGPTAPDFSALLTKAVEYELSDGEIGKLFAERVNSVAALQCVPPPHSTRTR